MFTKIDWQEIDNLIQNGYISKRKHPTHDLWILNYTNKTQIEWFWNKYTESCRGLIVDKDNNIISRPFKKFFSYEQLTERNISIPDETFEVFEKMDGCLGVSYFINDKMYIASRGSFDSDQAKLANELLEEKYKDVKWNKEYTYLFEIISPISRIIVDYGDDLKLVLLTIIETKTGKEISLNDAPSGIEVVKRYDGVKDYRTVTEMFSGKNKEGFVIRFSSGFRIKIKFDSYKKLHFYASKLSRKSIWEQLSNAKTKEEILNDIPDEFYDWCENMIILLLYQHSCIKLKCVLKNVDFKDKKLSKKEIAELILKDEKMYRSILFKMYNNQNADDLIWKLIKPKGKTSYFGGKDEDN